MLLRLQVLPCVRTGPQGLPAAPPPVLGVLVAGDSLQLPSSPESSGSAVHCSSSSSPLVAVELLDEPSCNSSVGPSCCSSAGPSCRSSRGPFCGLSAPWSGEYLPCVWTGPQGPPAVPPLALVPANFPGAWCSSASRSFHVSRRALQGLPAAPPLDLGALSAGVSLQRLPSPAGPSCSSCSGPSSSSSAGPS